MRMVGNKEPLSTEELEAKEKLEAKMDGEGICKDRSFGGGW